MPGNLEHALALAREGWRVFPIWHVTPDGTCACGKPARGQIGKHPRCWHGHNDGTTEEAQIRIWWSEGAEALAGFAWECDPLSNIGIAVPDEIVIVDIDPRNGGLETAEVLEAQHGHFPNTRTVASGAGGGGCHLYYSTPSGMQYPKTLNDFGGPGIDIKQLGGYVLAPPSNHKSGGHYELENDAPIAEAPAWLLALGIQRKERKTRTRDRSEHNDALSPTTLKEGDALIALLEPNYVEGSKHAISTAFGGYCKNQGKSAALVEYVIGQLPSTDVEMRVESALTFYDYENPTGWSTLKEHLPADVSSKLESIVKARRKGLGLQLGKGMQRATLAAAAARVEGSRSSAANPLDAWVEADDREAEVEPLVYLCEHFGIAEGKVTIIGGYAGAGKSPLGLLLGVCIASGKDFLGQKVLQRPVTFLMYEGERLSRIRRQRICRVLEVQRGAIPLELRRAYSGFTDESLTVLRDAALWYRDANKGQGAVFIHDTYTSAMRGVDQNSAEYAEALWALGDIGDETGAVHIALAHFKKSKDEESDIQMLSGHNTIGAAAQTVLGLLPSKKKTEEITIHPSRVPETPFRPTTLVWSDVRDPECVSENILERAKAVKWGLACKVLEAGPSKAADPREEVSREIYKQLSGKPYGLSSSEIKAVIPQRDALVVEVLKMLAGAGQLKTEKRGASVYYSVKA